MSEFKSLVETANQSGDPAKNVAKLKAMMNEDYQVSKEEADALFNIARNNEGMAKREDFQEIFVQAITSYLLYRGKTPGSVDAIEWIWLSDQIASDYDFSDLEKQLLANVALLAETLPANFNDTVANFEKHIEEHQIDDVETKSLLEKLKSFVSKAVA